MAVKAIPEGFETITPGIAVRDAARAIEFYKQAFGAVEIMRLSGPDGKIAHAELRIARANLMLGEESPEWGALSPQTIGGSPVCMHLYVEDVDAFVARAVAAGAKIIFPVADQFYGDRSGRIQDPFGHLWGIATHIEDMSTEEIQRRFDAFATQQK